MWLYHEDGSTLIAYDDDSGYDTNSYICLDAIANKDYVLEISHFSLTAFGEIKLSITPFVGCLAEGKATFADYESFVNINTYPNFTWNSYLFGNSSKIITWSPPQDGNYSISLESQFDNYLYVIDPSDSDLIVENINYNDDYNGKSNAYIENYYLASKKYFIVFSQFNNGNTLDENINNISVKFKKN